MVVESGRCYDTPLASLRASARVPMTAGDCEEGFELSAHFRNSKKPAVSTVQVPMSGEFLFELELAVRR